MRASIAGSGAIALVMRGQSDNSDSGDADGTVWVTARCSRDPGATAPPAGARPAVINSKNAEAMPIVLLFTSIALSKSGLGQDDLATIAMPLHIYCIL